MPDTPSAPDFLSQDRPNTARIYDYLLGGYHNFEIDRMAGDAAIQIYPEARFTARACRAFLRRVVQYLAEQGIDQYLDIGSGIPTSGNVHEVAQSIIPDARVVYVDIDSVAVAHSQAILKDNPHATAIRGDLRKAGEILGHSDVRRVLDFERPIAVLMLLVLQAVFDDDEACGAVRILRDALAPGSYIAVSQGTRDDAPEGVLDRLNQLSRGTPTPVRDRTWDETARFFEGLELLEPGVVRPPQWRPESEDDPFLDRPEAVLVWAGVGRKPSS